MAIHVQGKGGGGVAQIALHSLNIIAVLQGKDSIGVTKIMHPGVGRTDFCRKFFGVDMKYLLEF